MQDDYITFCEEKLWCPWKEHSRDFLVPPPFDSEAAPEPYLYFGARAKRLVVLTTNPGAVMCHQCRATVQAGSGPLSMKDTYAEAARKLGDFYEAHLTGQARHRITKQRRLSSYLGYDSLMQVELIPFHSASLPQKSAVLGQINKRDSLLGCYVELLGKFLVDHPVVIIQAAPARVPLSAKAELSPWLRRVAEIAGLDLNAADLVSLAERGPKTTVAAWVSKTEPRKALVLMMGTNNLPRDERLHKLAAALRQS
jgi:hypothetical protein